MTTADWSQFVTRINVNAPMDKLYAFWATRAGIEYWFLRMSEYSMPNGPLRGAQEFAQKGDRYCWRWHGWSDETTEYGTILEANGKDFFHFTFGMDCDCAVTIKQESNYNMVELIQSDIPTDDDGKMNWHLGCKTGWTFYLANLKSMAEGGIDLRNKDEQLKNMINA
jgi:hypothetical protein